jgi:hypothetical protein
MKFDDIFKEIGEFGPFQRRNYSLLIVGWMLSGMTMVLSVFVLGLPDHRFVYDTLNVCWALLQYTYLHRSVQRNPQYNVCSSVC